MIIEDMAVRLVGKSLNLDEPRTYNETIYWEKVQTPDKRKVLKTNNGSVRNIIVKNKTKIDIVMLLKN